MRSLHGNAALAEQGMSYDALVKRVEREKRARKEAEEHLELKSRELYAANERLKLTASSLESQRLQLNTILDNTLAGICLAQGDMSVVRANSAALIMFGYVSSSFKTSDLFADWDSVQDLIEEATAIGDGAEQVLKETEGRRANGDIFPMEFGLARMDHLGWDRSVWIFSDITKRKQAEDKRAALERELSQANKLEALGTLASGVAHEINTPIQYMGDNMRFLSESVSSLSDLISRYQGMVKKGPEGAISAADVESLAAYEDELDLEFLLEEASEAIDQSLEGAKQVAKIVNAIKEFSHPGEDEKEMIDLNRLVETTLTVTTNQWKYIADVDLDLDADLPEVKCMPSEIGQVILNLIVNAADALSSHKCEERGKISIKSRRFDDIAEIVVRDNGPGVPADLVERIFDPFFTTKDVGKGTGQGLAITHTIITQKHDGSIRYIGEEGKGAAFCIRLPVEPAA